MKRRGQKKRGRKPKYKIGKATDGTPVKAKLGRHGPLDVLVRQAAAIRRRTGVCMGCHARKVRCVPGDKGHDGPCQKCRSLNEPCLPYRRSVTILEPCVPYSRVTDAAVYREQDAPSYFFSRRWKSLEPVDIADAGWADDEVRTIHISLDFVDAPFEVQVRRFEPQPEDELEERWCDEEGNVKCWPVPPYAISNMKRAEESIRGMIEKNLWKYISELLNKSQGGERDLLWATYCEAFKQAGVARSREERGLLCDTFRLWAFCRQTSHPDHIVGTEYLGMRQVDDPQSPFKDKVPTPPVMGAQLECILFSRFLRPLREKVLVGLLGLMRQRNPRLWYTIYLVMFLLLHSCAMMTKQDMAYAARVGLETEFANKESIYQLMHGANILLAYFHTAVQGGMPFRLAREGRLPELVEHACLDPEQVGFVVSTEMRVKTLRESWNKVREEHQRQNDFYWVSQLYDDEWKRVEIK